VELEVESKKLLLLQGEKQEELLEMLSDKVEVLKEL